MISIILAVKSMSSKSGGYPSYSPVDVRPAGFFDAQTHSHVLSISDVYYSDEIKRKLCSEAYAIEKGLVISKGRRKYQFSDQVFANLFAESTHITLTAAQAFSSTADAHPGSIDKELTIDIRNPVLMVLKI